MNMKQRWRRFSPGTLHWRWTSPVSVIQYSLGFSDDHRLSDWAVSFATVVIIRQRVLSFGRFVVKLRNNIEGLICVLVDTDSD